MVCNEQNKKQLEKMQIKKAFIKNNSINSSLMYLAYFDFQL